MSYLRVVFPFAVSMLLSACGGGGGGGSSNVGSASANAQIVVSPSSALLTDTGQRQQFTAVVYRADGTVDSSAQVTWSVADPEAATINVSGNTATAVAISNPASTQVIATVGSISASASLAVADPAPRTHVLDKSLISSISSDHSRLTIQATPETAGIQPGDDVVTQGVLVKVLAVQISGGQLTLDVTTTTLDEAFSSFKFSAQDVPGSSTTQSYRATMSPQGVLVTTGTGLEIKKTLTPWRNVECELGGQAIATPQLTGGGFTVSGLIPSVSFVVEKSPATGGVTQITSSVSAQPEFEIDSPTLTFGPSLQGEIDCKVTLPSKQFPAFSYWGIATINFVATPVVGFKSSLTLSGDSVSFTGPQFSVRTSYEKGFVWSVGSVPTAIGETSSPTTAFAPFSVGINPPSIALDFNPYVAAEVGMNASVVLNSINVVGADFAKPTIGLDNAVKITSLPEAYYQDPVGYQGPAWASSLKGEVTFPLQLTGGMKSIMEWFGYDGDATFTLGRIVLFDSRVAGSPMFSLSTSQSTAINGSQVGMTVTQSNSGLFPESGIGNKVEIWDVGPDGSPTLIGTTTLGDDGRAFLNWVIASLQAGYHKLVALVYGLFSGIDLPYASSSVDVTVQPVSAAYSTISASPTSIPADGTSTSAVTVQLYDIAGEKMVTGGDSVQVESTLGTLSAVTDHNDGTYTAYLSSTTSGVAVLNFTVDGVVSSGSARIVVSPSASSVAITATYPPNGATEFAVSQDGLTVTFNALVKRSSVNTTTFTLSGPSGPVGGRVGLLADGKTAYFVPSTQLMLSATYTATITADITDSQGNPLASEYSWTFVTEDSITKPRFVTVDPIGKYVYVLKGSGDISQYLIGSNGLLVEVATKKVSEAWDAGIIVFHPSGKYAYIGNFSSNNVSLYTVDAEGSLVLTATLAVGAGRIAIDPTGKYAYVAALGTRAVFQYTIGPDGLLTPMNPASVFSGVNPKYVAVNPAGKYVYVTNDSDGTVSQYTIGGDGSLSPMTPATVVIGGDGFLVIHPTGKHIYCGPSRDFLNFWVMQHTIGTDGALAPTAASKVLAGLYPVAMAIDPTGKYAYVVNQDDNGSLFGTVFQYSIGADGSLTQVSSVSVATRTLPRSIVVDPSGKYVYVTNEYADNVSQYSINAEGALTSMNPATVR